MYMQNAFAHDRENGFLDNWLPLLNQHFSTKKTKSARLTQKILSLDFQKNHWLKAKKNDFITVRISWHFDGHPGRPSMDIS